MLAIRRVAAGALAATAMLMAGVASGEETVYRHSGTVISVRDDAFVLGEVGPWKVVDGVTVVTARRIEVTDTTEFVEVQRTHHSESGFPGDFTEDWWMWELAPGDYVTVECEHHGATMIALKVTVLSYLGR